MEAALQALLPNLIGEKAVWRIHPHQGKKDLLQKIESRLRGHREWMTTDMKILVLADADDEDCRILKRRMEGMARVAGLRTRSTAKGPDFQVVNRITGKTTG